MKLKAIKLTFGVILFISCNFSTKEETTEEFIKRMDIERKADSMTKASLESVS